MSWSNPEQRPVLPVDTLRTDDKAVCDWLMARGFVLTSDPIDACPMWERCDSHDSGYGYLTWRVMAHTTGYWVIVQIGDGVHRHGVNLGTVYDAEEVAAVFTPLLKMTFERTMERREKHRRALEENRLE